VETREYELPTNLLNFTQKDLTEVKIFQQVLGGYFFSETPCMSVLDDFITTTTTTKLARSIKPSVIGSRQPRRRISNGCYAMVLTRFC